MPAIESQVAIATFYQFARLPGAGALRGALASLCVRARLKGTILLAPEGVNGALAGQRAAVDSVLAWLGTALGIGALPARWTAAPWAPFERMRVRVQPQIVTMTPATPATPAGSAKPAARSGPASGADAARGAPATDAALPRPARAVAPAEWNAHIDAPDTLLLDVRNDYETTAGRFPGARVAGISSFAEFPAFADGLDPGAQRRVAMYCTGGIRCEKAADYLSRRGFEAVCQLGGGILAYLQDVPAERSRWQGHCFVFDQRERLDGALRPVDKASSMRAER